MKTRAPIATSTDYWAIVSKKSRTAPVAETKRQPRKPSPPPAPASASGIQTLYRYQPPQNELDFILELRDASEEDIRGDTVDLIECVQLRKVDGQVDVSATAKEKKLVREIAQKHDVDLMFWSEKD